MLFPHSALVIVDVQNDFIDGSLALKNCPAKQEGAEVVPVINNLINTVPFNTIAYTLDWHPPDHCSFHENVHLRPLHKYSPVILLDALKLFFINFLFKRLQLI